MLNMKNANITHLLLAFIAGILVTKFSKREFGGCGEHYSLMPKKEGFSKCGQCGI